MRKIKLSVLGLSIAAAVAAGGCANAGPSLERVPVPAPVNPDSRRFDNERPKPLPDDSTLRERTHHDAPPPPSIFDDAPLVSQRPPEQARFEAAYRGVGRPRVTVLVNRAPDGAPVPAGAGEVERQTTGRRVSPAMGAAGNFTEEHERTHLKTTDYDEAYARSVDYEALETVLTDVLACQGAVEIVSPAVVRQRLATADPKAAPRDAAAALDADVIIQVSAHPTRQTTNGLEIRIVAEAINVKGGQQIGRAMIDMPAPLEKTAINRVTRFVGRKLMADMTLAWTAGEAARPDAARPDAPRPDGARPDAPKDDTTPKPEAPKPESPRSEAPVGPGLP